MRHGTWKNFAAKLALSGTLAFFCASTPALAEDVTIGVLNTTSTAPVFLAVDRGYFKQEGLTPKIVTFDTPSRSPSPPCRAISISAPPE